MGDMFGFNTSKIKDHTREMITKKLIEVSGPKDLVLDTELMTPLDRIIEPSALKSTGVNKIFKLENPIGPIRGSPKRVYIVHNRVAVMKRLCAQVNIDIEEGVVCQYHLFVVPRLTHQCEMMLEGEGVWGHVTTSNLPFLLVPLDNHLISMESKLFYRSLLLEGEQSMLHDTATSLVLLQQLYGPFQDVFVVGECAKKTEELMSYIMEKSSSSSLPSSSSSSSSLPSSSSSSSSLRFNNPDHISQVIILDRACDLVTPLCSQVTYEGLLDEMFQIDCGFVTLGPEVTNLQKATKIFLNNQDLIFQEIRDRHFSNVSTFLSAKAKDLQLGFEKRKGLNIAGTRDFVRNELKSLMNQHNSLSTHVGACEYISKMKTQGEIVKQLHVEHSLLEGINVRDSCVYIEELISRQVDMHRCVSLLCLLSLTEGGLSNGLYKSLSTQFLQSYGYNYMIGLNNLKKLNMFSEKSQHLSATYLLNKVANIKPQHSFRSVAKKLNLIPKSAEEINLRTPDDISYVLSGAYTPLLCKVVEQIISGVNMAVVEETMRLLDIPYSAKRSAKSAKANSTSASRVVLVFFLGGVTCSEIAALKLLGKLHGCHIVVGTTSIINSQSFIKPLFH